MKKKLIVNDFIINKSVCNFRCEYCLSINLPEDKSGETDVIENAIKVLDIYESFIDADVLQLSGGEILLHDNILSLVLEKSKKYKFVYILTNGYLLNEHLIDVLSRIGNVVIGLSLDGHTLEMNYYRFKDVKILGIIMNNIEMAYKKNIPIVVNSVMHNRNVKSYHEFLIYLADVFPNISVFPIAVRGENADKFRPFNDDLHILMDIANDDTLYGRLRFLPVYFEELYKVMAGLSYTRRCVVPNFATELFDSGMVFPCPVFWVSDIGNIVSESPAKVFKQVREHIIYSVFTKRCGAIPFCKDCFTSYSLFNLYAEKIIDESQLRVIPYLDYEQIGEHILDIIGE